MARRLTDKVEDLWNQLRGDAAMPRRADWSVADNPGLAPHLFMIEPASQSGGSPVMVAAGGVMIDVMGFNPTGRPLSETLPPPLRNKLTSGIEEAASGPVVMYGCYPDAEGNDIVFRSLLLPLAGENGTATPEAFIGAISFKRVIYD